MRGRRGPATGGTDGTHEPRDASRRRRLLVKRHCQPLYTHTKASRHSIVVRNTTKRASVLARRHSKTRNVS